MTLILYTFQIVVWAKHCSFSENFEFVKFILNKVLFNPDKEKLYRKIAFLIITLSALTGLPLLSNSFDSFVG